MCFFFKQKTAYEMRISDWSSDGCSSDLRHQAVDPLHQQVAPGLVLQIAQSLGDPEQADGDSDEAEAVGDLPVPQGEARRAGVNVGADRKEARRVSTECVRPCSSR